MEKFSINKDGYYGDFGGAFIPEILHAVVEELKEAYAAAKKDPSFRGELAALLRDYAGRPSPLYYSEYLSARHGAQVYLKREDLNHTGSHKINNALGQILLARRMGKKNIIAETGAGQHGVAAATVCALMGMPCKVFMGALDVERQRPNVERMRMLGAQVVPVKSGNMTLKDATNEAIRHWCSHPKDTYYIIGSVVGPDPYPQMVADFQRVIGEEIKEQLKEKTGRQNPDCVIACVGGGSNAAGAFIPFLDDEKVRLIAAEAGGLGADTPMTAATLTLGKVGIIHGARTCVMQTPDGQILEPYSISAGLDYPGIGPLHAHLAQRGRMEVLSVNDGEALAAAFSLTKGDGIIPALESAHALAVLDRAKFAKTDVVVINLSGRGDKDMDTYLKHHAEAAKK